MNHADFKASFRSKTESKLESRLIIENQIVWIFDRTRTRFLNNFFFFPFRFFFLSFFSSIIWRTSFNSRQLFIYLFIFSFKKKKNIINIRRGNTFLYSRLLFFIYLLIYFLVQKERKKRQKRRGNTFLYSRLFFIHSIIHLFIFVSFFLLYFRSSKKLSKSNSRLKKWPWTFDLNTVSVIYFIFFLF